MPANPPSNMPRITPYLFYEDVAGALAWLAKAFGFRERMRMPGPDGKIMHAEMEMADGVVMMGYPGPEYRNDLVPASELSPLMRIEKFGDEGHAVPCDGLRGRGDVYGPTTVSATIPRSCVGDPNKVRVSVRGYFDVSGPNVVDWAPGFKKLGGWVRR